MRRPRPRSRRAKPVRRASRIPYLAALFDTTEVGLCFLDTECRVVAVNGTMQRFLPKIFALGRTCTDARMPCGWCPAREALANGHRAARVEEITGTDGVSRHLERVCHPLWNADGRLFGLAAIVRDVSWRVTTEREMLMAGQDIEMLLGSIGSILVSLDSENHIRRFNASAEAAFGLAAATVTGKDFFSLNLDWEEASVREAVAESRRTRTPVRVDEIRCRVPGQGERILGLTVNPVPVAAGAQPGVLILGQDLAEIKARELKAVHDRRMQAIGRLAAGIAHEINTPVQYVTYNTGFLEESFEDILRLLEAYAHLTDVAAQTGSEELADAIRTVRELAEAMDLRYLRQEIPAAMANSRKGLRQVSEIIAAMRQMSHPGTGEPLFFDMNAAVRDIVTITRNTWKHVATVELDLAGELPLVYGRPHEVSQVLLNVVINAAQAVEERVSREPWRRGRIDITTQGGPEGVTVAVTDNGTGITPADAGRIFDPFFTTKAAGQGTGQGLAISQAIMSRHGGGIELENRPGEGATFYLHFPADAAGSGT